MPGLSGDEVGGVVLELYETEGGRDERRVSRKIEEEEENGWNGWNEEGDARSQK